MWNVFFFRSVVAYSRLKYLLRALRAKWECNSLMNLVCSIRRALNRRIKCIKDKQTHFDFIAVILLYYGH
jgi:hypothetical protein